MKLGTKGRYAVMAMVDLLIHQNAGPVALADIALRQSLPLSYLEQLFARLRKAGLVVSSRGQKGGYVLAGDPDHVRIIDIIEAADEFVKTTACGEGSSLSCQGKNAKCHTHHLWEGLSHHIVNYLASITLRNVEKGELPSVHRTSVFEDSVRQKQIQLPSGSEERVGCYEL